MVGLTARIFLAFLFIFSFSAEPVKAQWQPVFGVSNSEIYALSSTENILIAGGNHRKVLYSADQGHTWRQLALDLPSGDEKIETLLATETCLWIVVPELGIRKSTDGGITWNWANEGLKSFQIHALLEQEEKLYAGTDAGIFVTTQTANQWQPLHRDGTPMNVRALFLQHQVIYAGTAEGEIYSSDNNGESWQTLTKGTLRKPIQTIVIKDQAIYVGTQGQGVYQSFDGGESWDSIKQGLGSAFVHDLALSDEKILAATDAGLFFMEYEANQWTKLKGLDMGEINAAYALHVRPHQIYAGTSHQGVIRSSDSGLHWELIPKGEMQQNIHSLFSDEDKIYAGISNSIYSTSDGKHWQKLPNLSGAIRQFAKSGSFLFSATDGGIYRKRADQVLWTLVSNPIPINCITSLGNNIFAGTPKDGILKSQDEGNTWEPNGLSGENILTLAITENNLLAGTLHGIFLSDTTKKGWKKVLDGKTIVTLKSFNNKILAGTKTGLYLSSDAGVSWTEIEYDIYTYGIKNIITTATNLIIQDDAGRFFVSYDEGKTWKLYDLPVLGNITSLTVFNNLLIAGTTDKGIWQHPLLFESKDEVSLLPFTIYPNPASEKIQVHLPVIETEFTLALKDIYGRTIYQYQSASWKNELDVSQLPKGTYFLQISGNGEKVVKRVIKQD